MVDKSGNESRQAEGTTGRQTENRKGVRVHALSVGGSIHSESAETTVSSSLTADGADVTADGVGMLSSPTLV